MFGVAVERMGEEGRVVVFVAHAILVGCQHCQPIGIVGRLRTGEFEVMYLRPGLTGGRVLL